MLKIIEEQKDKPVYTIGLRIDLEESLVYKSIWTEGLWMEYYEDPVVNFRLFLFNGTISVLPGKFVESFSQEEMEGFISSRINFVKDLEEWVDKEVKLELLESKDITDPFLRGFYKFDWEKYVGKEIQSDIAGRYNIWSLNSKIIHSIPYSWTTSGLKFYCKDPLGLFEKMYWFNLCLTKLYVDGKNKRCY